MKSHQVVGAILVAMIVVVVNCGHEQEDQRVTDSNLYAEFARECASQGVAIRRTLPDGRVVVEYAGAEVTVSLENLERNANRDKNPAAVKNLVAAIVSSQSDLPPWRTAERGIRISAERADADFGDSLHRPVTDTVEAVLVYVDARESRITWLTPSLLEKWGVKPSQAWSVAGNNMSTLLLATAIKVEPIDGMKLGMFDSDSAFKASFILSPNFKAAVAPNVGWPVFVVVPCRDFAYFFSAKELIPRVGSTVVSEYKASGYPLTPDVLEVSDEGIEAIATFPVD